MGVMRVLEYKAGPGELNYTIELQFLQENEGKKEYVAICRFQYTEGDWKREYVQQEVFLVKEQEYTMTEFLQKCKRYLDHWWDGKDENYEKLWQVMEKPKGVDYHDYKLNSPLWTMNNYKKAFVNGKCVNNRLFLEGVCTYADCLTFSEWNRIFKYE